MATGTTEKVTNNSGADYCKMPDGTLIVWGRVTVPADQWTIWTSYFPVYMKDDSYRICVTPITDNQTAYNISNRSYRDFSIGRSPKTASSTFDWIAIGRWK